MVKRGHEVDLEYSKKEIMDRINSYFENSAVERIKFTSFNDEKLTKKIETKTYVTNNKFKNKIKDIRNEKIKKSLIELTKVFKQK